MVTFALPGDNDAVESTNATPKPRPGLAFSQRGYGASPYGSVSKRPSSSTPLSRKSFVARSEPPASSLNRSFVGQRNIFRASTITDSPPTSSFSPSLPQSTMKRVFAPGATPEPSRVQRESSTQSASRGVAARAKDKDLFPMRIASPPPELTGEALAQKVPKDWDPKGSIYADQFLAHLCPADLDEDQRRQFFCILDLRRLKYAADEIFVKKGWKLNVTNFAKEFEKSRSIILLRYGLYEFQNVKPSRELLRRWRREHGIPEPEDEVEETPTKTTSKKKRKAVSNDESSFSAPKAKKRAAEGEDDSVPAPKPIASEPPAAATKNKRKASISNDSEAQPSKIQKPSSGARSLFEKAASRVSTTPSTTPAKSSLFPGSKPAANTLFRSVLTANTEAAQNGNIFGHLSDSSARNSADADEDTGSESDESPEPAAVKEDEPSAKRPAVANAVDSGMSSDAGTRESTPGRSLFDRVTKDETGEPVRAATPVEAGTPVLAAPPKDQTWNPSSAPIKFGPSTTTPQLSAFGSAATSTPSTPGLFGPKPTATTSLFGAPKQDKPAEKSPSEEKPTEALKEVPEPAKENNVSASEKPAEEPKAPAATSLFGVKPAATEAAKDSPAPATPLFSAAAPAATSNIFGASKPQADSSSAPAAPAILSSSTLFGSKPAEPQKEPEKAATEVPKPSVSFGGFKPSAETKPSSMFSNTPATNAGSVFGSSSSATPAKPLFGAQPSASGTTAPAAPAAATPAFGFGASASGPATKSLQDTSKPFFGAPKSPPAATGNSIIDGSPMKQDDKSPAKSMFGAANGTAAPPAAPIFGLGNTNSSATPSTTPAAPGSMFGAASNPTTNGGSGGSIFGAGSTSQPAGQFNFGGAASSGSSFNNPFASGAGNQSSSMGTDFNFGASAAPSSGSSPFQFGGGASGGNAGAPSTGLFGASQNNSNGATPAFGGSSATGGSGPFQFGAGSSQPSQPQQATPFGSNQNLFNLQPPTGGPSTGTNTPFSLGGGSSLATTPARGTPEPSAKAEGTKTDAAKGNEDEDGEKHEQINLTEGVEEGEESLHEVRAKVLKFCPADKSKDGEEKPKSKSPWSTQGVGPLRILQDKESKAVRLLLRAEPRGHVALNRTLLPDLEYKADNKYVKITTSNEAGDGLETWMLQVKTKDLASELAEALEKHKSANKKGEDKE